MLNNYHLIPQGTKIFTTNNFHTKISNVEFFQNYGRVELKDINKPRSKHNIIRVVLNLVHKCPKEIKGLFEELQDLVLSEEVS